MAVLKRGILLFWALWFTTALLTNIFDWLKHWNIISPTWLFASHNYMLIANVISIYGLTDLIANFFFIGILFIEIAIVLFFWLAFFNYHTKNRWIIPAFTLSAFLWASFLIAEELFIAYAFEQGHLLLFISQLICLLVLFLLPNHLSR